MRGTVKIPSIAVVAAVLWSSLLPSMAVASDPAMLAEGKAIVVDRKKGNCLACHIVEDGELPGNVAPALLAMQARFPDKPKLRAQIWDATVANPNTIMPPFGRHRILTEEEIDKVTEYIHSL